MHDNGVAVLQQRESPYTALVSEALQSLGLSPVYLAGPPKGAHLGPFAPRLLIWDVNGYSPAEKHQTANELKELPHGLIILADCNGGGEVEVCRLPGALAWLAKPRSPGELAAALKVASSLYERHVGILKQIEKTRHELNTRPLLDRAKRIIMVTENIGEQQAMDKITDCSRNLNRRKAATVRDVLHRGGMMKICLACKITSCRHHPK